MSKLRFKYGTMGSSKTAQLLITKFNYESLGSSVWLIKPSTDTRDGQSVIKSRIGLEATAEIITPDVDILKIFTLMGKKYDVVIADEAQFFTPEQIDQLHDIAMICKVPVLCYGLRTDFKTNFFPGSKRLMEIAESIEEIKMVCKCGKKATINARFDSNGNVITKGKQVVLGGDDRYQAMCYECWKKSIDAQDRRDD